MHCTIRKAENSDWPAIIEVLKQWNMHHVPSPEMPALDLACTFVATVQDRVVGVSGYQHLDGARGKTTLLAVDHAYRGHRIGRRLQDARLTAMHGLGIRTVTSNCDDIGTVNWYRKHYGYRIVGSLAKQHSFGREDTDHWTTLEMDLEAYMANRDALEAERTRYVDANHPPPLAAYTPLIINACLTGIVPSKTVAPALPETVDEIIDDAIRVHDAGASVVHIHARDDAGQHTSDAGLYEAIMLGIRRERPGLVCCVSTSGRHNVDVYTRAEVLQLTGDARPDMASLTLGSMNFTRGISINTIETIEHLALAMRDNGIKPELEVFDSGMINLARYLERHGIISGTLYFNLLLGNLNTAPADIHSLSTLTRSLPADSVWSAAGLGRFQLPVNTLAIAAGGHVRVGIEDTIYYDYEKTRFASNTELVERVARIATELQRPLADTRKARRILGLPQRPT